MEFTVYYTSTKPVPTGLRTKIEETVESLNNGHRMRGWKLIRAAD